MRGRREALQLTGDGEQHDGQQGRHLDRHRLRHPVDGHHDDGVAAQRLLRDLAVLREEADASLTRCDDGAEAP